MLSKPKPLPLPEPDLLDPLGLGQDLAVEGLDTAHVAVVRGLVVVGDGSAHVMGDLCRKGEEAHPEEEGEGDEGVFPAVVAVFEDDVGVIDPDRDTGDDGDSGGDGDLDEAIVVIPEELIFMKGRTHGLSGTARADDHGVAPAEDADRVFGVAVHDAQVQQGLAQDGDPPGDMLGDGSGLASSFLEEMLGKEGEVDKEHPVIHRQEDAAFAGDVLQAHNVITKIFFPKPEGIERKPGKPGIKPAQVMLVAGLIRF